MIWWILAVVFGPSLLIVAVACVLSVLRVPLPRKVPGEPSWFPDERDW